MLSIFVPALGYMECQKFIILGTWFYWIFQFPPTQQVHLGSIVSLVLWVVSKILLHGIHFRAKDPLEARKFILLLGWFGFQPFQDLGCRFLESRAMRVRSQILLSLCQIHLWAMETPEARSFILLATLFSQIFGFHQELELSPVESRAKRVRSQNPLGLYQNSLRFEGAPEAPSFSLSETLFSLIFGFHQRQQQELGLLELPVKQVRSQNPQAPYQIPLWDQRTLDVLIAALQAIKNYANFVQFPNQAFLEPNLQYYLSEYILQQVEYFMAMD